jgi:hypothetical protein
MCTSHVQDDCQPCFQGSRHTRQPAVYPLAFFFQPHSVSTLRLVVAPHLVPRLSTFFGGSPSESLPALPCSLKPPPVPALSRVVLHPHLVSDLSAFCCSPSAPPSLLPHRTNSVLCHTHAAADTYSVRPSPSRAECYGVEHERAPYPCSIPFAYPLHTFLGLHVAHQEFQHFRNTPHRYRNAQAGEHHLRCSTSPSRSSIVTSRKILRFINAKMLSVRCPLFTLVSYVSTLSSVTLDNNSFPPHRSVLSAPASSLFMF